MVRKPKKPLALVSLGYLATGMENVVNIVLTRHDLEDPEVHLRTGKNRVTVDNDRCSCVVRQKYCDNRGLDDNLSSTRS